MLSVQKNLGTKFPQRKAHAKTELKHKEKPARKQSESSDSGHSTSDASSHSSKYTVVYVEKPVDPNMPTNSQWKKNLDKDNLALPTHKQIVLKSEPKSILKSSSLLNAKVEEILSQKAVTEFFTEVFNIRKARGTETYEAYAATEQTVEDVEDLAKKNIVCSFRKHNYFHSDEPVFGYLIYFKLDEKNNRIPVIVPQLVAFESLAKLLKLDITDFEMEHPVAFKSKDETVYHYWIPMYINDEHYNCVKSLLKNVLVRLSALSSWESELPEFKPSMIEEVLFPLFGRLLNQIFTGKDTSAKDIEALAHFYHLISKLVEIYPKVKESVNKQIEAFLDNQNDEKVTKASIDNLLVLTLFSDIDLFSHEFTSALFNKLFNIAVNLCLKVKGKNNDESIAFALNSASKLLVRYRETAFFLLNEQTADDLEVRYGIVNKERVQAFLKAIKAINGVSSWSVSQLNEYFGDAVNTKEMLANFKNSVHNLELAKIKNLL